MKSEEILNLLSRYRFDLSTEENLKTEMMKVFNDHKIEIKKEYSLDKKNRPDFFLESSGVAIEVKIKGRATAIYDQCVRYCNFDEVKTLILVTNKSIGFPPEINSKSCYVLNLGNAWL